MCGSKHGNNYIQYSTKTIIKWVWCMCVCEAKYEYLSFFFLLTVHILFRKIEEIGIGRDREKKKRQVRRK